MSPSLPKIAFVSPHCVLDFTNGAATATRDGLRLLAEQGFECRAFCGTRLDDAQEGLLQESLFRRGVRYEVRKVKIPLLAPPTPSPKQTPSPRPWVHGARALPPSTAGEGSYDARLLFTVDGNLPVTVFENVYDLDGRVVQSIDALNNVSAVSYDSYGNEVSQSLPDPANGLQDSGSPTTTLTYDADGNTLSLTDPDSNATFWTYTGDGQVATQSQVVALGYNSDGSIQTTTANYTYQYDLAGDLAESVDADGRAIVYSYNTMAQETGETWYPTAADAAAGTGSDGSESFSYDVLGNMATASDAAAAYTYQYDTVGDVTSENIALSGLSVSGGVTLASTYDYNGNRTQLTTTIGSTPDFKNNYVYDAIGDMTQITQTAIGGSGSNSVTSKNVVLTYDFDQRRSGMQAYQSNSTSNEVYNSTDTYNADSKLTDLNYFSGGGTSGSSILAGYHWSYTNNGLVSDEYSYKDTYDTTDRTFGSTSSYTTWADTHYNYDATAQLSNTVSGDVTTPAVAYNNFNGPPNTNLGDTLDANGNRATTTNLVGSSDVTKSSSNSTNRILFDGTYCMVYDAAGNRIAKFQTTATSGTFNSSAFDITIYTWNEKNELTSVTQYATYSDYEAGTHTAEGESKIDYANDPFGEMVARTDVNAESSEYLIYDGGNVALILV